MFFFFFFFFFFNFFKFLFFILYFLNFNELCVSNSFLLNNITFIVYTFF